MLSKNSELSHINRLISLCVRSEKAREHCLLSSTKLYAIDEENFFLGSCNTLKAGHSGNFWGGSSNNNHMISFEKGHFWCLMYSWWFSMRNAWINLFGLKDSSIFFVKYREAPRSQQGVTWWNCRCVPHRGSWGSNCPMRSSPVAVVNPWKLCGITTHHQTMPSSVHHPLLRQTNPSLAIQQPRDLRRSTRKACCFMCTTCRNSKLLGMSWRSLRKKNHSRTSGGTSAWSAAGVTDIEKTSPMARWERCRIGKLGHQLWDRSIDATWCNSKMYQNYSVKQALDQILVVLNPEPNDAKFCRTAKVCSLSSPTRRRFGWAPWGDSV